MSRTVRGRLWCAATGAGIGFLLLSVYRVSVWMLGDYGVVYAFTMLTCGAIGFLMGPSIRRDVCDEQVFPE